MKKYLVTFLDESGKHNHYFDEAYNNLWILAQVATNTDGSDITEAAQFLDDKFKDMITPPYTSDYEHEIIKHLNDVKGMIENEKFLFIFDVDEQKIVWELGMGMMRNTFENGIAFIEVVVEENTEQYDLGNLKDIFGRGMVQHDFEAIETVFNEIWHSGEVLDMDEFARLIDEKKGETTWL